VIISSENTTTENGTTVHSSVTLDIDAIGVSPPFTLTAYASGERIVSHHSTGAEARKERVRVHSSLVLAHAPSLSR
jgi:hypothetical protein